MSEQVIEIVLRTVGGADVAAAFRRIAREAEEAAKKTGDGGKKASEAYDGVAKAAEHLATVQKGLKSGAHTFDDLAAAANKYDDAVDDAKRSTEGLTKGFEKARNWGAGIALAGAGILKVSGMMGKLGNDAVESENLIKESFKGSNDAIKAWGDNLYNTLGLSSIEVRKNAATFNLMFGSMGFAETQAIDLSKSLTKLAYDMSSFYNLDPSDAFNKLRAGITGESEPLKDLGILVTEETVKQYAYAKGIAVAGDELTEQQKVLARYGIIMQATAKAQGDLARTIDSPANAARRLSSEMKLAQQQIGEGSGMVRAAIQNNILNPILHVANSLPGIEKVGGAIFELSGYALAAGGSVFGLSAQVVSLVANLNQMGITTIPLLRARMAALWATTMAALTSIKTHVIATYTTWAAAAQAAAVAHLPLLIMLGKIAAVAILAAAAWYGVDKALNWREDKQLRENIAAGDATDEKRLQMVNDARKKKGFAPATLEQLRAWETDTTGNSNILSASNQSSEPPQMDTAKMQAQLDSALTGAGTMPNLSSATSASIPAPGGAGNLASFGGDSPSLENGGPANNDYTARARAIEDLISQTTNSEKKKRLQLQLRALRREEQDAKKADKALGDLIDKREQQMELTIAALQADTDAKVNALEEMKGEDDKRNAELDRKIADLQSRAKYREAELKASVTGIGDKGAANQAMGLASIQLNRDLANNASKYRIALKKGAGGGSDEFVGFGSGMSALEASGGMLNPYANTAAGATPFSSIVGGQGAAPMATPYANTQREVLARVGSIDRRMGKIIVRFEPAEIEDGSAQAVRMMPGGML